MWPKMCQQQISRDDGNPDKRDFDLPFGRQNVNMSWEFVNGAPKGNLKSRFHAGFSHKARPEIA